MDRVTTKDGSNSFVVLLLAPFLLYVHPLHSLSGKQRKEEVEEVNNLDGDRNKINIS